MSLSLRNRWTMVPLMYAPSTRLPSAPRRKQCEHDIILPKRRLQRLELPRSTRRTPRFPQAIEPDRADHSASSSSPESDQQLASTFPFDPSLYKELVDPALLGTRGEQWFFAQVGLALLVFLPPPQLAASTETLGAFFILSGLAAVAGGVTSIGSSISPFPTPRPTHELITSGAYSIVRHPMYTGVLLLTTGFSLWMDDAARLVLCLPLYAVLDKKASLEEEALRGRYPEYAAYSQRVGRLLPMQFVAGKEEVKRSTAAPKENNMQEDPETDSDIPATDCAETAKNVSSTHTAGSTDTEVACSEKVTREVESIENVAEKEKANESTVVSKPPEKETKRIKGNSRKKKAGKKKSS